jgi:hypothetical protein
MLMAIVPFVLSWLLKEVPLRSTLAGPAEFAAEQAAAGATGAEAIVEPVADSAAARSRALNQADEPGRWLRAAPGDRPRRRPAANTIAGQCSPTSHASFFAPKALSSR